MIINPYRFQTFDADALAYIAAVEAAGATVSPAQKTAINIFIASEKAASRWTAHKRLYLPIWGIANANAICISSLTSGTFSGGVTHASGYAQGNGSTGYFLSNGTLASIGVSATGTCGALIRSEVAANTAIYGVGSSGFAGVQHSRGGATTRASTFGAGSGTNVVQPANEAGIMSNTRASTTSHFARVRKTSGVTALGSNANTASVQTINFAQVFMASRYQTDAVINHSAVQAGAWFLSQMITSADVDAFSSNLKTLWETCTGLTLP